MLRGKPTDAVNTATLASYEVAFELGKNMVPFSHGELVEKCMISTIETGLSLGFLAEWWKWPSRTPVPSSLGYLPRVESQSKIRHYSHFL